MTPVFIDVILLDIRNQLKAGKPIELMSARFHAVEQRGVKLEGREIISKLNFNI
jgi:hypothetical protein